MLGEPGEFAKKGLELAGVEFARLHSAASPLLQDAPFCRVGFAATPTARPAPRRAQDDLRAGLANFHANAEWLLQATRFRDHLVYPTLTYPIEGESHSADSHVDHSRRIV